MSYGAQIRATYPDSVLVNLSPLQAVRSPFALIVYAMNHPILPALLLHHAPVVPAACGDDLPSRSVQNLLYHGLARNIIPNLVPCDLVANVMVPWTVSVVNSFVGSMSKVNLLALTA